MGVVDWARRQLAGPESSGMWGAEFVAKQLSTEDDQIKALFGRTSLGAPPRTYRLPSVDQALGVPAIQRAVSLISSTTGMLSMQGFRNGALMDQAPPLVIRPDPYETPDTFYSMTSAQMAKYGEFVWWIASTDSDGNPAALINVPLRELRVEATGNRLHPRYEWGSIKGGRWTPASPDGRFVHKKYPLAEPFALRGAGPLQFCRAAASITVEADAWAAQFFADGGGPSAIIKHAGYLSPALDENGLNEADRLRAQFVEKPHNVPRVIDQSIESVDYKSPDVPGAQMLEARLHQSGDAARMFGLPGKFVEYVQSGTSLTYQTIESAFEDLIKTCLQPLYLEPIEQAMSDLLPRSTVARFNVKGFLRADIKTRFEVHGIAIDKGIYGPDYAQREEGILPGDVEFAPVPYSPPSAVPTSIARAASLSAGSDVVRCGSCNRIVAKALGPGSELNCPRCKSQIKVAGSVAQAPSELLTLIAAAQQQNLDAEARTQALVAAIAAKETKVEMRMEPNAVNVNVEARQQEPTPSIINIPERQMALDVHQEPPVVNLQAADMTPIADALRALGEKVDALTPQDITVPAPVVQPADMEPVARAIAEMSKRITAVTAQRQRKIERDSDGRIIGLTEWVEKAS